MSRVLALLKSDLGPLAFTLGCGLIGGFAFNHFRMPLPWMLGAICVVTALALSGAKVRVQPRVREPMIVVIGVMLGSAFTPGIFEHAGQYLISLALLALYVVLGAAACITYLRKVGHYDPVTAFFSGIPGGLMEMAILGSSAGADDRKIFLTHGTRVFLVVFTIPFWFRLVEGYTPRGGGAMGAVIPGVSLPDLAILAVCGVAGYFIGKALRFPAYRLTGPLALSAAAHMAGLTASKPPGELIILAQLVLGSSIGCRYLGVRLQEVLGTIRIALGSALILIGSAVAFSYAVHSFAGVQSQALLLSLSPGGVVEMTLIALSLGIDVAFVTVHHLARIVLAIFVAPLAFRIMGHSFGIGPTANRKRGARQD